jgi:hypothetical protein
MKDSPADISIGMRTNQFNIFIIIAIFVGISSSIIFQSNYYHHGFVSADGSNYLSVAQNILDNQNLMVNSIAGEKERIFFSMWPAGYPIMISLTAKITGTSVFWASKILNILFLGGILLLFLKTFKEHAFVFSFILLLSPMIIMAHHTASEIQYIFGLLWFSLSVIGFIEAKKSSVIHFINITLACIFLFLSRYIGYFCVGVLSLVCLYFLYHKLYKKFWITSASIVFTTLFVAGYLFHNYLQSGYLTGMPRFSPIETPIELLSMLVRALFAEFNLITIGFGQTAKSIGLYIITFILQILIIYYFIRHTKISSNIQPTGNVNRNFNIFFLVGVLYYIAIVFSRFTTYFTELNYRFMFPGTFLLLIGFIYIILHKTTETFRFQFIKMFIVLSLFSFLVGNGLPFVKHVLYDEKKYTYTENINQVLGTVNDIPQNSVVIFGDRSLLYLRTDLSIASPIFVPNFPEAESWDDFLARLEKKHPGRKYYVMIKNSNFFSSELEYEKLSVNYHSSVVDFIFNNKNKKIFEIAIK